jgi:hypothetical protein
LACRLPWPVATQNPLLPLSITEENVGPLHFDRSPPPLHHHHHVPSIHHQLLPPFWSFSSSLAPPFVLPFSFSCCCAIPAALFGPSPSLAPPPFVLPINWMKNDAQIAAPFFLTINSSRLSPIPSLSSIIHKNYHKTFIVFNFDQQINKFSKFLSVKKPSNNESFDPIFIQLSFIFLVEPRQKVSFRVVVESAAEGGRN